MSTCGLTGHSPAIARIRRELSAVASTESVVLVTGETGTGKGVVARELHRRSRRASRPFVQVNCASLATSIIESELFGHERGAFTGAVERRIGRFELAADGTIFLDEIGDLAPSLQAKLLRVLEDREFERVGGVTTLPMRARIVAATNRDLHRAVAVQRFRADLFFRLNVFQIRVPPLRERRGDIPLLAREALERLRLRADLPMPRLCVGFERRLARYAWPGNVRELMNAVERAVVRHPGGILDAAAFDAIAGEGALVFGSAEERREHGAIAEGLHSEREIIEAVLDAEDGNVTRAARCLGVPRGTLRYRIRKLRLGS